MSTDSDLENSFRGITRADFQQTLSTGGDYKAPWAIKSTGFYTFVFHVVYPGRAKPLSIKVSGGNVEFAKGKVMEILEENPSIRGWSSITLASIKE